MGCMSSMTGVMWDGRVTICTNTKRTLYCIKQLYLFVHAGTDERNFLEACERYIKRHDTCDPTYAYTIENLYRGQVLGMKIVTPSGQ